MSKIIISMVNFNSGNYIKDSLRELNSQTAKKDMEIWVLDNNSTDESPDFIKESFPKVKLIKEDKNLGFAKGQNVILKKAKGDYYLIMNPDTKIHDDAIEKMVNFMEENSDCGISSCRITDFNNQMSSNGGNFPFGLALLSWLFNLESLGINSNFHRMDKEYYLESKTVDWVGGTFMMIRKEVLEKIGFFNEKYFMYVEDVELCYRASKKGFKIMINPEVEIKHKSGGSSDDPRYFQWKNEFKNLILFYKENVGVFQAGVLQILIYISVFLRMIAFGILGKGGTSRTYAKVLAEI